MGQSASAEVYEAILAGNLAWSVAPRLNQLPHDERQSLLCTVCAMHDEIARNCLETGNEVSNLLASQCPFYIHGVATCLL
jgi:hypothetical protein